MGGSSLLSRVDACPGRAPLRGEAGGLGLWPVPGAPKMELPRMRDTWLLLAPLPALALGLLVATGHGVPWAAFLPGFLAVALGVLSAVLFARGGPAIREGAARVLPVLVFLGIAATLLAPGVDGVRRWLVLGPIRLNMSAALVPWLVLGF